jgi:transposase
LRKTGDVAIGKVGGHRQPLLAAHENWLRERIASQSHVSLRRLQVELNNRGGVVGYGAVKRAAHRIGLSFKKAFTQKKRQGLILRASAGAGGKSKRGSKPRIGL